MVPNLLKLLEEKQCSKIISAEISKMLQFGAMMAHPPIKLKVVAQTSNSNQFTAAMTHKERMAG